jgi:hypothetical protein
MQRMENAPFHQTVTDMSVTTNVTSGQTEGLIQLRVTLIE